MKFIFLLPLFLIFFLGCNNSHKKENSPPVIIPEPTEIPEEILLTCLFTENVNSCNIPKFYFRKLVKLSNSGILLSKVLDLKEVKEKYYLSDDHVLCLKNNFCKQEF